MNGNTQMKLWVRTLVFALALNMALPPSIFGQQADQPVFKQEELEQILAPIALYPDALLSQIFMASTYPLEIVQAARWTKEHKDVKEGDLTALLEKEPWDPSVKSLVNFPDILFMMNEKLDWTQKLGDAFLAQQSDVMVTVQVLRKKAQESGNLKTTSGQKVIVEKETIIIQSASPQVVYVPTYDPLVVYGTWPYPAYPPYYYYPPGYVAGAAFVGFAIGAAWGYAWGNCNWRGGNVDIDINRNTNINVNIDRGKYATQYQSNRGTWQHNPEHRKGVSYRDPGTSQRYNRTSTNDAVKARETNRGRAETGRQNINQANADPSKPRQKTAGTAEAVGRQDKSGQRTSDRENQAAAGTRDTKMSRENSTSAFSGMDRGGSTTRDYSSRGSASRQSSGGGRSGGRR